MIPPALESRVPRDRRVPNGAQISMYLPFLADR